MKIVYLGAPHSNYFGEAMKIYLAGAAPGNNCKIWKDNINDPEKAIDILTGKNDMNIHLAGLAGEKERTNSQDDFAQKIYVLESFYYIQDWMIPYIDKYWNFMLDSGAFTFMSNAKKSVNWDEYLEKYADFIIKHNIDLFFELDIDSLVGLKEVERLRKKLENMVDKQCIPVWHRSRGKDEWIKTINEYEYVAIGGLFLKKSRKTNIQYLIICFQKQRKLIVKFMVLGLQVLKG